MAGRLLGLIALVASISVSALPLVTRNPYTFVLENPYGDSIFELGNVSYLANTKYPKGVSSADCASTTAVAGIPVTVIQTNVSSISKETMESAVTAYLDGDDVFSDDFLDAIYVSSSVQSTLDPSAIDYLTSLNVTFVMLDASVTSSGSFSEISLQSMVDIPAGPYLASLKEGVLSFATVYRLYPDTYRTFLFGAYDSNDGAGNHHSLGVFLPKFWDPMIP